MTSLPPLTMATFFSRWHFDPWVTGALVVIVGGYLAGVAVVRRRGGSWPSWRVWAFIGLGPTSVVIATMSSLGIYDHVLLWPAAVQLTLLLALTPLCLGLGDPIGLARGALPKGGARRLDRILKSGPVRVLTFPAVGAVLATITQFVVYFSGYLGAAMRSDTVLHVLQLQMVVTGCLFALPLLGVELLPAWCNQGIRMAFAGLDGLLDAIPGIAVIGASHPITSYWVQVHPSWAEPVVHDQWVAGGMMITISELIALPFVGVLFRAWIKEDARAAAQVDRALDLARPKSALDQASIESTGQFEPESAASDRPWWETDPGPLADRAKRYGWSQPKS